MSIQNQKITEAAIAANGVQSQPDKLTGTAAQNKKVFDNLITAVVKERFNALIDELTGAAAAVQLGITTIPGFSAGNIQTALEEIITVMQGISQGSVANGSITLAKLAAEVTAAALGGAAASHTHGAGDIASGVLDTARIPVLDSAKLGAGSVGTEQLAPAAVTAEKLAALAVLSTHLAVGAVTRAKMAADAFTPADNAGSHNAVYRGKNLGSAVTAAQWAAIEAGTFEDLFIGDYWEINGVNWRIAAFDYYLTSEVTDHHAVIVPDSALYEGQMNTSHTTDGAYVSSKMFTSGLTQAKTMVNTAFGEDHILSHYAYLKNAATNGYETGGNGYQVTVVLMTEQNLYGGSVFANRQQGTNYAYNYTIDNTQFPLFAFRRDLIANNQKCWLRDIARPQSFCCTWPNINAYNDGAAETHGVRPSFCIK